MLRIEESQFKRKSIPGKPKRQPGDRICEVRNANGELTLKEELFVRAICCYPEDPSFDNMSEAMRQAGYKGKHIGVFAYQMMQRPKVMAAVDKYRLKIMQKFDIGPEKVLQEIAATAFSDFGDFYSDDGTLKNLKSLTKAARAALHGVEVQMGLDSQGRPAVTQKIKLNDKLKACELLGKYHKLWTEKFEFTPGDNQIQGDIRAEQTRQKLLEALGPVDIEGV